MSKKLYLSISKKSEDDDLLNFIGELFKHKINEKYTFSIVSDPIYYFRNKIIDHVVSNGFDSLLRYSVVMDDVTTPSMHFDDIENVFHRFVERLNPADELIIIDPYFYPKQEQLEDIANKFISLISPIYSSLKNITVVSNGNNKSVSSKFHAYLKRSNSGLLVKDIITNEFHDRFWINPVNQKGLIVGTSINGIGKKISLVDKLRDEDVELILNELKVYE
ncbi:hypothetical protein [Salinivibrio kushneri]|uniref:Uncharacterized protein n=1 Tax=Salinivibrio kushneri TaxID=1908198 RepID=A0AA47KNS4_9GAMM|nr:hypothetical protein [Salinivibrio kushneri]WBA10276.1 hypothetical protein N8M53_13015 [Salinivibrio kushneri]